MIPQDVSGFIRGWIAEAKRSNPSSLSADGRAVMIYGDIGGAAYITPDGEILTQAWDSEEPPAPEADPTLRLAALVIGAEKHPQLRPLLPSRPSDAVTCKTCGGTGRLPKYPRLLCLCGGIGWMPAA